MLAAAGGSESRPSAGHCQARTLLRSGAPWQALQRKCADEVPAKPVRGGAQSATPLRNAAKLRKTSPAGRTCLADINAEQVQNSDGNEQAVLLQLQFHLPQRRQGQACYTSSCQPCAQTPSIKGDCRACWGHSPVRNPAARGLCEGSAQGDATRPVPAAGSAGCQRHPLPGQPLHQQDHHTCASRLGACCTS